MMRMAGADDVRAMANRYGALAGSVTRSATCRRQTSPRSPPGPPTPRAVTVRGQRARTLGSFCAPGPDVLCDWHARPVVVPALAEPEVLSDGCGIGTIGSGPAA